MKCQFCKRNMAFDRKIGKMNKYICTYGNCNLVSLVIL